VQTHFTSAQLQEPGIQTANDILRACVHCGFCLSACPTYALLGDERDSPRGRIYLIKDMLESDAAPTEEVVRHVDRCLSCLGCMTACPSGVHYQHYVDNARIHIEENFTRPWFDRTVRRLIAAVLPYPGRAKLAFRAARLARPFAGLLGGRLKAMLKLVPNTALGETREPTVYPAQGVRRKRVALLPGCVQDVLRSGINDATIRLLTRLGCEVVIAPGTSCCGALTHHLGYDAPARDFIAANVEAWIRELDGDGIDAIVTNAAGCGTVVKDYGHMAADDPALAEKAKRVAGLTRDISELLTELAPLKGVVGDLPPLAYQDACSLRNGQQVTAQPRALLSSVGFDVRELNDGALCCGSAGSYNILQPDIAAALRTRKAAAIGATAAQVAATGNIGCLTHLQVAVEIPVLHTVELLDWATGGPNPLAAE